MLTSKKIKKLAKKNGADLVGITTMHRFEGLPKQMDPRTIFPEAKSMIVLGFRMLRGNYRGVEEGTFFATHNLMGYEGTRWIFQPVVLWNFTKILEDHGFESIPIPDHFPWSNIDNINPDNIGQDFLYVNVSNYGKTGNTWSRPVDSERPKPDVFFQLKIAGSLAGLGEIGHSGIFLTPEYGPRQMLAAIITDAPLEPDPVFQGSICDNCMECVKNCPAKAISTHEKVKIQLIDNSFEWAKLDFNRCSIALHGGVKDYNPFMLTKEDEKGFTEAPYTKSMHYKIGPHYQYGRSISGFRGCHIACMIHLEEKGILKNKFKNPFRTKQPWKINWDIADKLSEKIEEDE
ncbi:MAG: hypothetical protein A2096_08850 [Spirochaetes bacterium GWF1_41_5]|nr:MAG: hypothetical protein A2096_08850 [Spirochaetes bacterium GWF1_41_5]HBE01122.1 hypothetical protein [Spirochaetia bacterium]